MRKSTMAIGAAAVIGMLTAATGAAQAARGESSIVLDRHNPYSIGDVVTFTSSTTLSDRPWETVRCFQGGELVYYASHPAYWPNASDDPGEFLLGPTEKWTSGAADCVAELRVISKNGSLRTVASVDFAVTG